MIEKGISADQKDRLGPQLIPHAEQDWYVVELLAVEGSVSLRRDVVSVFRLVSDERRCNDLGGKDPEDKRHDTNDPVTA